MRKRPLNKKELAKTEEDIVETTANYLTVHETKLKASKLYYLNTAFIKILNCNAVIVFRLHFSAKQVDLTEYVEKHEFVFDAVLNEEVSNDEVSILQLIELESINWPRKNPENRKSFCASS